MPSGAATPVVEPEELTGVPRAEALTPPEATAGARDVWRCAATRRRCAAAWRRRPAAWAYRPTCARSCAELAGALSVGAPAAARLRCLAAFLAPASIALAIPLAFTSPASCELPADV